MVKQHQKRLKKSLKLPTIYNSLKKDTDFGGSVSLAGAGRANNADNVGKGNNVNGVVGSNTCKKNEKSVVFAERQNINKRKMSVSRFASKPDIKDCRTQEEVKRKGNLYEKIIERTNLEAAADKMLSTKSLKGYDPEKEYNNGTVFHFVKHRKEILDELQKNLADRTFEFGPLECFSVCEPKKRVIHHPKNVIDKVVHNAMMNIIGPILYKSFIADTYGSIKGRGITMAAKKLQKAIKKHPDWYFIKIDAKKYYDNVDHDILKVKLERIIKCKPTLELISKSLAVLDNGLAIGSYPSQYFANYYLTEVDHKAKEQLRLKHYFRLMDDTVMLVPDKETANRVMQWLKEEYSKLHLEIKNNWRIAPISYGIDFMGYVFFPTHTRLRKRIKTKMKRNARLLIKKGADDKEFKRKMASHYGWCVHADCKHLLKVAFKDKIELFTMSKYERLSEKRSVGQSLLGLPTEQRVSITELVDKDIVIHRYAMAVIKGENKILVEFSYPEDEEDTKFYFITRSAVIIDRVEQNKDLFPCIVTVKKIKKYYCIE